MANKYQPFYVVYAKSHGREPDDMWDHDKERWPGGKMCGYILWMGERMRAWYNLTHHPRVKDSNATLWPEERTQFHEWLMNTDQPPLEER